MVLLEKLSQQTIATPYYYHCDINGAPIRLTDNTGKIVWSEQTGVWGEKRIIYANLINNPIRFQGQYYDQETGLHYNRFRYYDPYSNSYISQDPIGLLGGINIYNYVINPLSYEDILGLSSTKLNGKLGGTVGDGLEAHHLIPEEIWKKIKVSLTH